MSGGHFNYESDHACNEMFNWQISADYGFKKNPYYKEYTEIARRINPMEDKMLSELVCDIFCLIHSLDWYKSGDTEEETYRKDVEFFKAKWFGKASANMVRDEINKQMTELKAELDKEFAWLKGSVSE